MIPLSRQIELKHLVEQFHCEYAETLDRGDVEHWCDFFTPDAIYRITGRDNIEAGFPLDLVLCDSPGMFRDRAYAILNTEMHGPRYVKHFIANIRILGEEGRLVSAEANYIILETVHDQSTRILQAGKYVDLFEVADGRCAIKSRQCIYDTVIVPDCMIYPA